MNNKIKPGMVCVVTGYRPDRPAMAANVGREVTVVRWLGPEEDVPEVDAISTEYQWLIRAPGLVVQYGSGKIGPSDYSGARPHHLMPLHPPSEEPSQCARQSKLIPA